MGSAKKWKTSIRLEPGCVPECPLGAAAMMIGRWLELKGIETKGSRAATGVTSIREEPSIVTPSIVRGGARDDCLMPQDVAASSAPLSHRAAP